MRASHRPPARYAAVLLLAASGALALPEPAAPGGPATEVLLSPSDMLSRAKEIASKMQDSLRNIVQMQEVAKKQKDIIKLNCVNDKLIQAKGHMTLSDQAMSNLNEAVAKNDDEGRGHEYTRVTILYQKVLVLVTEANNCIGEDLSYVGEVTVTVDIDSTIPVREVTAFDTPTLDAARVPSASQQ